MRVSTFADCWPSRRSCLKGASSEIWRSGGWIRTLWSSLPLLSDDWSPKVQTRCQGKLNESDYPVPAKVILSCLGAEADHPVCGADTGCWASRRTDARFRVSSGAWRASGWSPGRASPTSSARQPARWATARRTARHRIEPRSRRLVCRRAVDASPQPPARPRGRRGGGPQSPASDRPTVRTRLHTGTAEPPCHRRVPP